MFVELEGVREKVGWRRLCCTGALICCLDSCRYLGELIDFHADKPLSLVTITIRKNMS